MKWLNAVRSSSADTDSLCGYPAIMSLSQNWSQFIKARCKMCQKESLHSMEAQYAQKWSSCKLKHNNRPKLCKTTSCFRLRVDRNKVIKPPTADFLQHHFVNGRQLHGRLLVGHIAVINADQSRRAPDTACAVRYWYCRSLYVPRTATWKILKIVTLIYSCTWLNCEYTKTPKSHKVTEVNREWNVLWLLQHLN